MSSEGYIRFPQSDTIKLKEVKPGSVYELVSILAKEVDSMGTLVRTGIPDRELAAAEGLPDYWEFVPSKSAYVLEDLKHIYNAISFLELIIPRKDQ